jgi:hypothetical protein
MPAPLPDGSCDTPPAVLAAASPENRCFLQHHASRCHTTDDCVVRCYERGGAPDLGGGCYHLCTSRAIRITAGWPPEAAYCNPLRTIDVQRMLRFAPKPER